MSGDGNEIVLLGGGRVLIETELPPATTGCTPNRQDPPGDEGDIISIYPEPGGITA